MINQSNTGCHFYPFHLCCLALKASKLEKLHVEPCEMRDGFSEVFSLLSRRSGCRFCFGMTPHALKRTPESLAHFLCSLFLCQSVSVSWDFSHSLVVALFLFGINSPSLSLYLSPGWKDEKQREREIWTDREKGRKINMRWWRRIERGRIYNLSADTRWTRRQ